MERVCRRRSERGFAGQRPRADLIDFRVNKSVSVCDEQLPAKATCEKRPCCLSRQVCLAWRPRSELRRRRASMRPVKTPRPRCSSSLARASSYSSTPVYNVELGGTRDYTPDDSTTAAKIDCEIDYLLQLREAIKGSAANPLQAAAARSAARVVVAAAQRGRQLVISSGGTSAQSRAAGCRGRPLPSRRPGHWRQRR